MKHRIANYERNVFTMSQQIFPTDQSITTILSREEQRALLKNLRSAIIAKYRPHLQEGAGPIRMMARLVAELEQECRQQHIEDDIIRDEIVNRTIGDINLRK